jgi:hypothetical protein
VAAALEEITRSSLKTLGLLRFVRAQLDPSSATASSSSAAGSTDDLPSGAASDSINRAATQIPSSSMAVPAATDLRHVIVLCRQVLCHLRTKRREFLPHLAAAVSGLTGQLADAALRLTYTDPRLDSDVRRKLGDLVPHVFKRDYSFGRRWWPKVVEMTLQQDKWYTTTSSTTFADGATRQQRHTELEEITIGLLAELLPIAFYQVGRAMLDTQITPTLFSALGADKPPKVSCRHSTRRCCCCW